MQGTIPYYVVDAFSEKPFGGNQAGVCVLREWLPDGVMQSIASENNLSETVFMVPREDRYDLRWFTPTVEVELCGHGTMACAYVITHYLDTMAVSMRFQTLSGMLSVTYKNDLFELDFPARFPRPLLVTPEMENALGCKVVEAATARDLMLVLETEQQVRELKPDFEKLVALPGDHGVIVTAKGETADFVSRFFVPKVGIPEDPVTGSSHTTLIPFWSRRLSKDVMVARQLSKRGGTLYCKNAGDRVKIGGHAALYLKGEVSYG